MVAHEAGCEVVAASARTDNRVTGLEALFHLREAVQLTLLEDDERHRGVGAVSKSPGGGHATEEAEAGAFGGEAAGGGKLAEGCRVEPGVEAAGDRFGERAGEVGGELAVQELLMVLGDHEGEIRRLGPRPKEHCQNQHHGRCGCGQAQSDCGQAYRKALPPGGRQNP